MLRVICLDVDGTVTDGILGPTLPGAAAALDALRAAMPVRLVSNATSIAHARFATHLIDIGVLDRPEHLLTPVVIARRVLMQRGHAAGLLLVDPDARADFAWFRQDASGPAVLLGSESHDTRIADLQPAFRCLLDGAHLYTLQRNRYYRRNGELVTDLGPVAAFLSYASGREAETLGKPSPLLFDAIAADTGARRGDLVMVGDDAEFDVAASVRIGMQGVLVRTGKYRPGDEARVHPAPTAVIDSLAALPAWLQETGRIP